MGNFMTTLGQMAQGYVPTAMKLDAANRDERLLASQEATNEAKRLSLKQSTILNGYEIDQKRKNQEDDNNFRSHLQSWEEGRKRIDQGDYSVFERELAAYNSQAGAYADGHTIKGRASEDGKATILDRFDKDGKLVDSSQPLTRGEITRLYDFGMGKKLQFMNPERYDQTAKAAAALMEKQKDRESLERRAKIVADARMYETDGSVDATELRANATTEAARIRAAAPRQGGRLTLAQERTNAEIDAAHELVSSMDPAEVQRRSQKATNTGRENPDYDPSIARAANLAGRRKIGPDEAFDQRRQKPVASMSTPLQAAQSALSADPGMAGMRLGEQTVRGFKVLDKDGRHVGYFGKSK